MRIEGDGVLRLVPLRDVRWPERTRHGPRVAELKGGGSLQCAVAASWDALARACGREDSVVVRAKRSWTWVLGAVLAGTVEGRRTPGDITLYKSLGVTAQDLAAADAVLQAAIAAGIGLEISLA